MAEINVKTIDELQSLDYGPNSRLSKEDLIAVYQTQDGTTNKVTLQDLKNLTLEGHTTLNADSSFIVNEEGKILIIGKEGQIVPSDVVEEYFATNGVVLNIGEEEKSGAVTSITGDKGIEIKRDITDNKKVIIEQGPADFEVRVDQQSFNIKNTENSLKFTGAVQINPETGTIHVNDNDTVLQAITEDAPGGINISKIEALGDGISFDTRTEQKQGQPSKTILQVKVDDFTETSEKSFSLKAYETELDNAIYEDQPGVHYTCTEELPDNSIFAIHFNPYVQISPVYLNGKKLYYFNKFSSRTDAINQAVQEYAILQKDFIQGNNSNEKIPIYRVILADCLQDLYNDTWSATSDGTVIIVDRKNHMGQSDFSFTALAAPGLLAQDEENNYYVQNEYIKNISKRQLDANFTLNYSQVINSEGNNIIPDEYISDNIKQGKVVIIGGNTISLDPNNQDTLKFTNLADVNINIDGGATITDPTERELIRATCSDPCNNGIYTIDNLTILTKGFYLIEFKYGLGNNTQGVGLKINNATEIKYIYYDGSSTSNLNRVLPQNFIEEFDSILFYYDGQYFYFISNDNSVGDRINISESTDRSLITFTQNGVSYSVNSADFSSKNITSNSSLINIDEDATQINIGLNLPSNEDASNLYLNGTGQWSTVNNTININEATQSFIINLIYPIGSYFETYYSPNDFNPNSDILWSGGNVYQWVMVSSSTDPNDSTKTIYKWRKDINSEYNDGGLPTN